MTDFRILAHRFKPNHQLGTNVWNQNTERFDLGQGLIFFLIRLSRSWVMPKYDEI